jgi:hypothetical protein
MASSNDIMVSLHKILKKKNVRDRTTVYWSPGLAGRGHPGPSCAAAGVDAFNSATCKILGSVWVEGRQKGVAAASKANRVFASGSTLPLHSTPRFPASPPLPRSSVRSSHPQHYLSRLARGGRSLACGSRRCPAAELER